MPPPQAPEPLLAKSNPPRTLVAHCLDVARAAEVRLRSAPLRTRLADAAGMPLTQVHIERLCVLAGLHDLGKAGAGFQAEVRGRRSPWGHVSGALAAVLDHPPTLDLLQALAAWFEDLGGALYASICHHGGPVPMAAVDAQVPLLPAHMDAAALKGLRELFAALRQAYPGAWDEAPVLPWTPALSHLVAGIIMGADWLGSGVMGDAETAHRQAGIWGEQTQPVLGELPLNGLQSAVAAAPLGQRLLLVEAPTGGGKTEAALLRAERLVQAGLVSGLYFAVPTRSAATELHARIGRYLGAAVPGLRGAVTRVLPGMIETDDWQQAEARGAWHLGGSRQAMLARVGIGTIDQAMLAVLRARHAWMRRAWLLDRLLVIDEVHAGDAYMRALVERLTASHVGAGGHAMLMSATLGADLRAKLLGQPLPTHAAAKDTRYPCVWLRGEAQRFCMPAQPVTEVAITQRHLEQAMATAAADACVLIIRSTVADAVADWQALRDAGVQALLHHSRWADRDRQTLDSRVLDRLGERTRLPGSIVVGTQTLEQSLNIDADLLITDACPGDVLLQRLGRLWRFRLSRPPGCAHRRCVLIDPGPLDDYLSADPKRPQVGRAGQGWAWVYPLLPVAATLDWLEARGRIRVPDDARALVEAATHPEALEALSRRGDAWAVCHDHGLGATLAQRRIASASWIDETHHYAPDMEPETTTTRLGIGSVTVETPGLRSPLDGEPVPALPVPARWLEGIAAGTRAEANGSELRIGGVLLTYDERGLLRG